MIQARVQAATLDAFYASVVAAQRAAHGQDYCAHHDAIREVAGPDARYAELGVNEGATLAAAVLAGYGQVMGVDRDITPWKPYAALFGDRATVLEQDSRLPIGEVDVLLIDSCHEPEHLRAELAAHAPHVTRHIIAHDTARHPRLHGVLTEVLAGVWRVRRRCEDNVGYTLMERVR